MEKEIMDEQFEFGRVVVRVSESVSKLFETATKSNSINSPELYEVALDILKKANNLVDYIENHDENLDAENSKLGEVVEELFKEDPVTDYVNAKLKYKEDESKDNLNKMYAAGAKLEKHQQSKENNKMTGLVEWIRRTEDAYHAEMYDIMNKIEELYANKSEYTAEEVEILRVYLRNLSDNSPETIEAVSDKAVTLAFRAIMRKKGLLN